MYKIEKNVTMPVQKKKGKASIYPFDTMEVDDSFFVDDKNHKSVYQAAYTYGKRHNMKFIVTEVPAKGKDKAGVRVWRVPIDFKV